jgi:hypothetical protein
MDNSWDVVRPGADRLSYPFTFPSEIEQNGSDKTKALMPNELALLDALQRKTTRASIAGRLINLQATTRGRVIKPGMPVVAYIQTPPRTFFEYVLSPVTSGFRQALVEDTQ